MSRNPKALGVGFVERRHDFKCTPIADYYRTPGARELAHGVKAGNERAIMQMAQEMAALLGPSDVLVPIPSRTGRATVTLAMAKEIARRSGAVVADVLRGAERTASLYDLKRRGVDVSTVDFGYRVEGESPNNPVLIDTVLDTGATVRAAHRLMPNARVVVHSSSNPDPEQALRIQEASALFKRWFGGSKFVDSGGRPLVLFHGSSQGDIDEFSRAAWKTAYGHFFTDDKEAADFYAYGSSASTSAVYLRALNPLRLDALVEDGGAIPKNLRAWVHQEFDGANIKEREMQFIDWISRGDLYSFDMGNRQNSLMAWAEEGGFDAVVFWDAKGGGGCARSYVVFEPGQIKSFSDNCGDFDPENPSIRSSRAASYRERM
jgi:hypothetical protein